MTQSAIIVGAGIGGLATARALETAGWNVRVLEAAGEVRAAGAGISITQNGMTALDALGLGDKVRAAAVRSLPQGILTDQGAPLIGAFEFDSSAIFGIHRGTLLDILLGDRKVETGMRVTGARDAEGGRASVTIEGDRPETFEADLVVAADGIDSAVRKALWPKVRPDYSGATSWYGLVEAQADSPSGPRQFLGQGAEFGMLPINDGRIYWWGMAHARMGRTELDEVAAAKKRFELWAPEVLTHIAATPQDSVIRRDLWYLPTALRSYHRPGVVLVGDAAHAMMPTIGQGGNTTLEDAATLGALLQNATLADALERYDDERIRRTQRFQRRSLSIAKSTVGSRLKPRVAARNGMLNLMPTLFVEIAGDWMLQWRAPVRK